MKGFCRAISYIKRYPHAGCERLINQGKKLILFTTNYPFGTVSESFIDPEIPFLASLFKDIVIVPLNHPKDVERIERSLPDNVIVDCSLCEESRISIKTTRSILRCIFSIRFYQELAQNIHIIKKRMLKRLTIHLSEAIRVERWLIKQIENEAISIPTTVIYTYWLDSPSTGVAFAKMKHPEIKLVSRAHRFDLYENVHDPPYLPFRHFVMAQINAIFLISKHGQKYLAGKYPQYSEKCIVSRLGVIDPGFVSAQSSDGVFRIVSCSYLAPVKRIDLLIEGLREVGTLRPEERFEWTHLGYGPEAEKLKRKALTELPSNVKYKFLGYVGPGEVIEYYKHNRIDAFINVSRSEGIPVSIMEAQSCGIPVIATGVGGTSEIISQDVGFLLCENPTPQDISRAILEIADDPNRANGMKKQAKDNWQCSFNAETNYSEFANSLYHIGDGS